MNTATEKRARTEEGKVVSNKADKTIAVLVERKVKHPLYGKVIRRSTKFLAHDEKNECGEGDTVLIEESKLSLLFGIFFFRNQSIARGTFVFSV